MIQSSEITWRNIKAYIQGNIRYQLFYSKYFKELIPLHIFEQISYRIRVMDQVCYFSGSCKECGCETPHLQMANKACKGDCYPEMKNEFDWKEYKISYGIRFVYTGTQENRDDFQIIIKKEYKNGGY